MTRTIRDEIAHSERCESLGNDSAIGEVVRNGKPVFYVFINGIKHERRSRYALGEMVASMLDKSDYLAIGSR